MRCIFSFFFYTNPQTKARLTPLTHQECKKKIRKEKKTHLYIWTLPFAEYFPWTYERANPTDSKHRLFATNDWWWQNEEGKKAVENPCTLFPFEFLFFFKCSTWSLTAATLASYTRHMRRWTMLGNIQQQTRAVSSCVRTLTSRELARNNADNVGSQSLVSATVTATVSSCLGKRQARYRQPTSREQGTS